MSQYTFNTHLSGKPSTVVTGFCPKTATFYGAIHNGGIETVPVKKSKPLPTETALFNQLDSWGVAIPKKVEEAIYSDVTDWNHGEFDLMKFNRKIEDFGYQSSPGPMTATKNQNARIEKQRCSLR